METAADKMEHFRNKKILIVGLGKTGFALINFFNRFQCEIRVTDERPIFDLSKAVKRLKKMRPSPEMTFGEHKEDDFLDADIIVHSAAINPNMPQLELARGHRKEVYSQVALASKFCTKPVIAVCGSYGRTTVCHMINFALQKEGKKVFLGGSSDYPFINYWIMHPNEDVDYIIIELSSQQMMDLGNLKPYAVIYTNISNKYPENFFNSLEEFIQTKTNIIHRLGSESYLIVNYDSLGKSHYFDSAPCPIYWYTRKSFVQEGIIGKVFGTHFHDKRIHCGIHYHSEFKVNKMRIVGEKNRENLLAAITTCKALNVSDDNIQNMIEQFPGIPHRLEYVMEKNGVKIYNDSKSETMEAMAMSLASFKDKNIILIAGGKDTEQPYEGLFDLIEQRVRVLILMGECKERLNRSIGDCTQTYLVGSFEESILMSYQKSRTGDVILLSPGNSSTDIFRDYEERGNYFKKLVYQL